MFFSWVYPVQYSGHTYTTNYKLFNWNCNFTGHSVFSFTKSSHPKCTIQDLECWVLSQIREPLYSESPLYSGTPPHTLLWHRKKHESSGKSFFAFQGPPLLCSMLKAERNALCSEVVPQILIVSRKKLGFKALLMLVIGFDTMHYLVHKYMIFFL